jgi:WD40-like Beta Propeller Repeat
MRSFAAPRSSVVAFVVVLVAACSTGPAAPASPTAPSLSSPAATAEASVLTTIAPSPVAAIPTVPRLPFAADGLIVFYRTNDARSNNTPFMIDPDGSNETELAVDIGSGAWSTDGTRRVIAVGEGGRQTFKDPEGMVSWGRLATIGADGSGFQLLDAYPGRKINLGPIGWSADGSSILVSLSGDDLETSPVGLSKVRASDGGGLSTIVSTPVGYQDFYALSPDGTHVLVKRGTPDDSQRFLLVANADGSGLHRLSSPDPKVQEMNLDFWEGASEAWSPDGARIAFCAHDSVGDQPFALFIANADGTGRRQTVGPEIGAISARWSPDGTWIAFTSKLRAGAQVWKVHPDGTGLVRLTDGTDGSVSAVPVWSSDGSKVLFQRLKAGQFTLWTMNADGSGQKQLSATPLANGDFVGGYAWWPAPRT